ncbi:MAG: HAD family phosphatase [Candidatus Moraniibacteriota bacterium]
MITTIIFDLAEVYLKGFYGIEDYLKDVLNLEVSEIKNKLQGPEFRPLMEGKITEDEFWERNIQRNNWNVEVGEFKNAIRNNFEEIEGTRDIIEKLKADGYKLGLLSDHSREWIDHCNKKFDYHKLFHSTQYSFEVECCKTDKKTFEILLGKLGERAEDCLFIDDNENNINTAKSIGLSTIQFKNPDQLKKELALFLAITM